jgi:dTDP-4-amino-4,6-dideoxygalactose transaminase
LSSITQEKPALLGGEKAKQTPYGKEARYGDAELNELREALEQGTLFYASGCKVKQLEAEFAEKNGVPYAVACTSGTAAIHTALLALGVSPGDEVITAPITDMGTVSPILFQGAVPIFADVDPHTYMITPKTVAERITPKTRAVVAVHLGGNMCDVRGLRELCDAHGIALVEDCAQTFGAEVAGQSVGTIGHIGCFSYNEFKHISCGDGGLVITRDSALAERARLATDKAYNRFPDALERRPTFLANNYRMTELQGAVALAQLRKLDRIVERRRAWCAGLNAGLQGIRGLHLPAVEPEVNPSWWFYFMRVNAEELETDTDTFGKALQAEGLPIGIHYIGKCLYSYPLFANKTAFAHAPHVCDSYDYPDGLCPVAEAVLDTGIILFVNEAYTEKDLAETLEAFHKVVNWYAKSR